MNREPSQSAALPAQQHVASRGQALVILRGVVGGTVGGVVGFYVFKWLRSRGCMG